MCQVVGSQPIPKKPKKSEASNAGAGAFFDWLGDGVRCCHRKFPWGITLNRSEQHIFICFILKNEIFADIYGTRKSPVFLRSGFFPLENEGLPLVALRRIHENPLRISPMCQVERRQPMPRIAKSQRLQMLEKVHFLIGSGMVWDVSMKGFHGASPWTDLNSFFYFHTFSYVSSVSSWRVK